MSLKPVQLAQPLAPEDIKPGLHVAVLREVVELVPRACSLEAWEAPRLVRLSHVPCETEKPALVLAVCLPFVLVESDGETRQILDTRRSILARVCPVFARASGCRKKLPREKGDGRRRK